MNSKMMVRVAGANGFIAALDQSGGSTPGRLHDFGIPDGSQSGEAEMFNLMHAMRVRIMTASFFSAGKVLAAILFEGTMNGEAEGRPVPHSLWNVCDVVPFVKVDKGLWAERDGVSLTKSMPALDVLLERAARMDVFGTKMRSVINLPSPDGIATIVAQQFDVAARIDARGLMPIIEPEVLIGNPAKAEAETLLRDAVARHLDALPTNCQIMLKLTIFEVPDSYLPLVQHPRVIRVVALSGGYTRADACRRLSANHGMIASFSRALIEELLHAMSGDQFDTALSVALDAIYGASSVMV